MQKNRRRILALDGGGIKGAFAAAFLATIEEATGKRVADHFDLIAGTSTGGIIALGLGLGMSGREIVQFYVNDGHAFLTSKNRLTPMVGCPGWPRRLPLAANVENSLPPQNMTPHN